MVSIGLADCLHLSATTLMVPGVFSPPTGEGEFLAPQTDRRTRVIRLRGAVSFVNQIRLHFYAAAANLYCGRVYRNWEFESRNGITHYYCWRRRISATLPTSFFFFLITPQCSFDFFLCGRKIIVRRVKINRI